MRTISPKILLEYIPTIRHRISKQSLLLGVLLAALPFSSPEGFSQSFNVNIEERSVCPLPHPIANTSDNLVVALDEVAWCEKGRPVRFERIPNQSTLESLGSFISTTSTRNGPEAALVLYRNSNTKEYSDRSLATREVVVSLGREAVPEQVADALNAEYLGEISFAPGEHRFRATSAINALSAAKTLFQYNGVLAVHPQIARWRENKAIPNDPLYSEQWHLRNTGEGDSPSGIDLNIENAWNTVRGRGVIIGIIDNGVAADHPDLSPNVRADLGYDFRDRDNDPSPFLGIPNQQDPKNGPGEDSHGTLVAGIAAARGFDGVGVTGVAPEAGIADIRLIGDYITDAQEADAINHRNDVIDIKNNSWGASDNGVSLSGPDRLAQLALHDAVTNGRGGRGSILIWSGGNGAFYNENSNKGGYANSIYTIAVGAINDRGERASYSEIGSNLLVTAPAGDSSGRTSTTSDLLGDDGLNIDGYQSDLADPAYTRKFSGTSSSAPMIAGLAALMLEANPELGWRDVQEILIRSSRMIDESADSWFVNAAGFHFSDEYGAGLPDALEAVTIAESWTNLEPRYAASRNLEIGFNGLPLPDGNSNIREDSYDFSGTNLRLEQVTATVFIDHPFRGELAIELESPSGTVSQLVTSSEDDSPGYYDWTFSSVQFWGEDSDGIWKLRITDEETGNAGVLLQSTVTLHGTPYPDENIPATPQRLAARGSGTSRIALDWEDHATNETGYRVEISPSFGSPWIVLSELPANTTHHEVDYLPQGRNIYFRVIATNNEKQSAYSNTANAYTQDGNGAVLLQTGFEESEGFTINTSLNGNNEWSTLPSQFIYPAQGVIADIFSSQGRPGHGQQAFVGRNWQGIDTYSTVYHPTILDPSSNTSIQFKTLVSITDSTIGDQDGFSFDVFNQDGDLLCSVLFDNFSRSLLYYSETSFNYINTSVTFERNVVYDLDITINFETNRWSATLGSTPFVSNIGLFKAESELAANLGSFGATWHVLDTTSPGNNAMYFDDLRIAQLGTASPNTPTEFTAESLSSSIAYLTWAEDLLAEQYEIQRSPFQESGWTTIATVEEDTRFFIDAFLTPNTNYYYRIRALSGNGNSEFTSSITVRTYTEYEAWKDKHLLEVDTPDYQDSDLDNIPLILEYALDLNPRRSSNRGLPRAKIFEDKQSLQYFRARTDVNYHVETSDDLINWTTAEVDQESNILGLYVTASIESPESKPRFFRLVVSEKE